MVEDRSVLGRPGPAPAATVAYGPHPDQVIECHLAAPVATEFAHPTVVFVHGGYWRPEYDRAHARSAAGALAAAGFPTALPEYRRIPGEPDTLVDDVRAAVAAVASGATPLPSGPVLVVGHSAGGHLALIAAASADIGGCLALAPVADLLLADSRGLDDESVRAFLGGPATSRPDLDPTRGQAPPCPTVVLHGTDDELVPIEVSQSYALATGVELRALPGAGHFALIDPLSAAWPCVIAELRGITERAGIE